MQTASETTIKHTKDIPAKEILQLYLDVGWSYRNPEKITKAIKNSTLFSSAWKNGELIGVARAVGDDTFNATIWDVAVKKEYQRKGIGTLLINSMLKELKNKGIPLITLYTECTKKNFYSKLGFTLDYNRVLGMYKYNYRYKD